MHHLSSHQLQFSRSCSSLQIGFGNEFPLEVPTLECCTETEISKRKTFMVHSCLSLVNWSQPVMILLVKGVEGGGGGGERKEMDKQHKATTGGWRFYWNLTSGTAALLMQNSWNDATYMVRSEHSYEFPLPIWRGKSREHNKDQLKMWVQEGYIGIRNRKRFLQAKIKCNCIFYLTFKEKYVTGAKESKEWLL